MSITPRIENQKVSEDAYFVVDFNESLLIRYPQESGPPICPAWVYVQPVLERKENSYKQP